MRKNQLRDQNGRFIKDPYLISFKPTDKTIIGNIECIRMDADFRFFYDIFNKAKRCMAEDVFEDKLASMPDFYIVVPMPVHDIEIHIDGPDDLSPVHQCKVADGIWCPKWLIELTWFGAEKPRVLLQPVCHVKQEDEQQPVCGNNETKGFLLTVGVCLFGLILAFIICALIAIIKSMVP